MSRGCPGPGKAAPGGLPDPTAAACKHRLLLSSVHCLLTAGLEDSVEGKVNKTSWCCFPWHPVSLCTVGTPLQESLSGTGLLPGAQPRPAPAPRSVLLGKFWRLPGRGGRGRSGGDTHMEPPKRQGGSTGKGVRRRTPSPGLAFASCVALGRSSTSLSLGWHTCKM